MLRSRTGEIGEIALAGVTMVLPGSMVVWVYANEGVTISGVMVPVEGAVRGDRVTALFVVEVWRALAGGGRGAVYYRRYKGLVPGTCADSG